MHEEQGGFETPPQQQDISRGSGPVSNAGRGGSQGSLAEGEERGSYYPSSRISGQPGQQARAGSGSGEEQLHSGAAGPPGEALQRGGSGEWRPGEGRGKEGDEPPGRRVGEVMRRLVEQEGWQLVVEGHSLGAGAAALVSLKLREHYPGKCGGQAVAGVKLGPAGPTGGLGCRAPLGVGKCYQGVRSHLMCQSGEGSPCLLQQLSSAKVAALPKLQQRHCAPAPAGAGLRCLAYSVPGGLVSKNLAHAMAPFTTSGGLPGRQQAAPSSCCLATLLACAPLYA